MGQEPRIAGPAIRALIRAAAFAFATALAAGAAAQAPPASTPGPRNDRPAAPAYEDRIIEGLAPPDDKDAAHDYNAEGLPRFLRLETRLGTRAGDDSKYDGGLVASGVVETPNHGVLSFDASYSTEENGHHLFTLRQRGLPLDGGWSVNNELGVSTPVPPGIMRLPTRVFVPSVVTRGAGTEWLGPFGRAQFQASAGEIGRLSGTPVAVYVPLSGNVAFLGAQGRLGGWDLAARYARADGVSQLDRPTRPADFVDSDSTHFALRRFAGDHVVQAQVLATQSTETADTRYGAWVDGEWKRGTSLYGWGLYRLDPNLTWAGQAMASDLAGAYLRGSWHTRQWTADTTFDVLRSVSGTEDTGVLATASGRWRYSRRLSLGTGGTVRSYKGNGGSGYADARWENDWGSSGFRTEYAQSTDDQRVARATLDHNWLLPVDMTLNTSLTGGRESGPEAKGPLWGAAVSLTAPLFTDALLTGNASTERRGDGNQSSSATVSLIWRLARNWSLEGNFVYSQGRQQLSVSLDPLAPPDTRVVTSNGRSVYLVLRYEDFAGSRGAPLGGSPKDGGGRIEGVVFLDANRNGSQEAGEAGAAGVTVYLDGRYAVRTDSLGRFEFAFVAPGTHAVTVLNETLPLPWESGETAGRSVEVRVRDTTRVPYPVTRRSGE